MCGVIFKWNDVPPHFKESNSSENDVILGKFSWRLRKYDLKQGCPESFVCVFEDVVLICFIVWIAYQWIFIFSKMKRQRKFTVNFAI